MNKNWVKMILIAGLFLITISSFDQAFAMETEGLVERDLTVKETIDPFSGTEKVDIGEVEKETEHDTLSQRENHESLHDSRESNESIRESTHDSSDIASEHESSSGMHEPIEQP